MRFFTTIVSALALVTSVVAQSTEVSLTDYPQKVTAGQTYTIKYTATDLDKPCTLTLRRGNPNDLSTIATLTTSATGGSYQWKADSNLVAGTDYAFEIQQGSQINYSGQFVVHSDSAGYTPVVGSTPVMTPTSVATMFPNSTMSLKPYTTPVTPYNNATVTPIRTPGGNSTVRIPATPTNPGGAASTGALGTQGAGTAPSSGAVSVASSFGLVFSIFAAVVFLQ